MGQASHALKWERRKTRIWALPGSSPTPRFLVVFSEYFGAGLYLENLAKKPREAPEYSGIWGRTRRIGSIVNSKSLRALLGSSKRRSRVTGPSFAVTLTHSLT